MNLALSEFIDFINKPRYKSIDKQTIYLERVTNINKIILVFYCMQKVYKNKTSCLFQLVVA